LAVANKGVIFNTWCHILLLMFGALGLA
jgi:hypothetical protein